MIARLIGGRDQQEEDVHRLAVQRREIDAAAREGDGPDQAIDRRMSRVRHGHALTDAGRAEFLAAEDRAGHAVQVAFGEATRLAQTPDDLPNRILFAGRLQVDEDCLTNHEIRKLHPALHRRTAGPATRAGTRGFRVARSRPSDRGDPGHSTRRSLIRG